MKLLITTKRNNLIYGLSIGICATVLLNSCSDENTNNTTAEINLDGKTLMENNCLICHGNGSSHDDIIAPPMMGVKNHYYEEGMSEDVFVKSIVDWTLNPTESNSKMPGAIKRFNVMPKQDFNTDEVTAIAKYMFNNEMEKPQWFDQHMKEKHSDYIIDGLELNDGEKWKANAETTSGINQMIEVCKEFTENPTIEDYQDLSQNLGEIKSEILNQCTMKGPAHDNLHSFLMPLIGQIKSLKSESDLTNANEIFETIQLHLAQYDIYFM